MAYQIKDLKNLDNTISDLLNDNLSENDEKVLFSIQELLERNYKQETEVLIDQKAQIEVIKKYGLDSFLEEIGAEKSETQKKIVSSLPESVINFQKPGTSLDGIRLSSIEQAINGDSEIELRQAIVEASKLAEQAGPFQEQAKSLEFKARQAEAQRYEAIKQQINKELNKKDHNEARKAYKRLETLRPDATGILKELFEKITFLETSLEIDQNIIRAKTLLKENIDYEKCKYDDLLRGLDITAELIQGGHADAELKTLKEQAQEVRAQVAREIGGAETLGAAGEFEDQVKKYAELLQKKVLEVEDPKDKSKKVPTSQLHREALKNLRNARIKTVKDRCADATVKLDSNPGQALLKLDDLKPFIEEFKGDDVYSEYTDILGNVNRNKKRWEKAQKIVEEAVNHRDPRARLVEYERAHNTFPGHQEANKKVKETRDEIRLDIKKVVENRLQSVNRDLNIQFHEIPFDELGKELDAIDNMINEFGTPEGVLKDLSTDFESTFTKLLNIKQRHIAIKDVARQVGEGLKADAPNTKFLDSLLKSLPEEDVNHSLLGEVRIHLKGLMGDQSIYEDALKAKGRGDYKEYYGLAEKLNVDGGLSKKRSELLFDGQLQIDLIELQDFHNRGDYSNSRRLVDALLNRIDKGQNPVEYEKCEKIQRTVEEFEQTTAKFNLEFNKARESFPLDLVRRLGVLNALAEKYVNRSELMEAIKSTREQIRTAKFDILRSYWQRKQQNQDYQFDYEDAYKIHDASSILQGNDLIGNSALDIELTTWADTLYQKAEIDYYKHLQNWDEIIKKLTDEYGENPPPHIHKQLLDARRAKVLKVARDSINGSLPDPLTAISLLEEEIKQNGGLNDDFEFILLKLVACLFQGVQIEFLKSQLTLINKNNTAITEIQGIIDTFPEIKRGKKTSQEYFENGSYDLLYEQLNSVVSHFKTLLILVQNLDLQKFILFQQVDFNEFKENLLTKSLDELRSGLRNKQKSVAEHIQYLFWIDKLSPSATMIKAQLDELKERIPDAIDKELKEIDAFCNGGYISMGIHEAYGKALNLDTTVNAFRSLPKHLENVIDLKRGASLADAKKKLTNCLTEILGLQEKIKPYMQYLAALNEYETINRVENQSEPEKRKKELEEIKKSNSCFLFEKGQINTDAMDRIVQQDPIINRFYNLNQPDVVKFMDWINATDMNRKKAIEQAKNIVDGFNYNKGNKLTRNDKIEAWVEKYTTCYDAIITACKVIFNLGTERQEDVFGLDAITKIEDSYMPGKIVNGVVEHLKLAEERKKNLNEYNVWYKTMINLAIPVELRTDEARVSQKLPFFDNQLNNMVISTDIKGLKQLKEKLEAIIANFNEKYGKLPKLTAQPNNDVSERLLKEGKESESAVLGIKVAVESIIKGLSVTCDGFKPLMSETAKKLSFKSPPFVEIKMNLEKLYNIDPGNEGLADLKKTYQKKISRKRLWWWPF